MRICVIDDHEVVRAGLRAALEKDPDLHVVGEAATGHAAMDLVGQTRPAAVVMDFRLPDISGDELCRRMKKDHPDVAVVILTTFLSEELVRTCLDAGADGFVTKAAGLGELREILGRIRRGEKRSDESVSAHVHRLFGTSGNQNGVTPRQEAVLALAADGLTYGQIASRLSISQSTVRFHIQSLKERLGARSKTDLIAIAIRNALIPPVRGQAS